MTCSHFLGTQEWTWSESIFLASISLKLASNLLKVVEFPRLTHIDPALLTVTQGVLRSLPPRWRKTLHCRKELQAGCQMNSRDPLVSTLTVPSLLPKAGIMDTYHCSVFDIGTRDPKQSCHAGIASYLLSHLPSHQTRTLLKENVHRDSSIGINGKRHILWETKTYSSLGFISL